MTTMAPEETLDRRSAAKIGSIVIARHGQPHADRSVRIDQRGYRDWWRGYDLARLHPETQVPHGREIAEGLGKSVDLDHARPVSRTSTIIA